MATDLAPYANLRLLMKQPVVPVSLRNGPSSTASSWIIDCYAKGEMFDTADLPSVNPRGQVLKGYVTQWAVLPSGGNWLVPSSQLQWNTTGLVPSGLRPGAIGDGFLGVLNSTDGRKGLATILAISDPYGIGGVGAELRQEIGDSISIQLQVAG